MAQDAAVFSQVNRGLYHFIQHSLYQSLIEENLQLRKENQLLRYRNGESELNRYYQDQYYESSQQNLQQISSHNICEETASDNMCYYLSQQDGITKLRLVSSSVTNQGVQYLFQLVKLKYLIVELPQISLKGLHQIGNLTNLVALGGDTFAQLLTDPTQVHLHEEFFLGLAKLTHLERLNIGMSTQTRSSVSLQDCSTALARLVKCENLYQHLIELVLTRWIIPEEITGSQGLLTFHKLHILDLSSTTVTDALLRKMLLHPNPASNTCKQSNYLALTYLGIRDTPVTLDSLTTICKIKSLISLDLNQADICSQALPTLNRELANVTIYQGQGSSSDSDQDT